MSFVTQCSGRRIHTRIDENGQILLNIGDISEAVQYYKRNYLYEEYTRPKRKLAGIKIHLDGYVDIDNLKKILSRRCSHKPLKQPVLNEAISFVRSIV
jgi:hypothetical protein